MEIFYVILLFLFSSCWLNEEGAEALKVSDAMCRMTLDLWNDGIDRTHPVPNTSWILCEIETNFSLGLSLWDMEVNLLSVVEAMMILLQEGPFFQKWRTFSQEMVLSDVPFCHQPPWRMSGQKFYFVNGHTPVRIDFIQSLVNKLVQSL